MAPIFDNAGAVHKSVTYVYLRVLPHAQCTLRLHPPLVLIHFYKPLLVLLGAVRGLPWYRVITALILLVENARCAKLLKS